MEGPKKENTSKETAKTENKRNRNNGRCKKGKETKQTIEGKQNQTK